MTSLAQVTKIKRHGDLTPVNPPFGTWLPTATQFSGHLFCLLHASYACVYVCVTCPVYGNCFFDVKLQKKKSVSHPWET